MISRSREVAITKKGSGLKMLNMVGEQSGRRDIKGGSSGVVERKKTLSKRQYDAMKKATMKVAIFKSQEARYRRVTESL